MRKKRFKCGHLGRGQFCHRCDQAAKAEMEAKGEKDQDKSKKLTADAERLYAVPKTTGAVMTASVPT